MDRRITYTADNQARLLSYLIIPFLLMIFLASCKETQSSIETQQVQEASPTPISQSPSPTAELFSTLTFTASTPIPTMTAQAPSAYKTLTPSTIPDELNPASMTARAATQEAHEQTLLLTPSPTPTAIQPLTDTGPWLVGRTQQDLILLNRDGTGLTHLTIDPDTLSFPQDLKGTISSTGNWIVVKIGNHPEYQTLEPKEIPCNLAIQLIRLPSGIFTKEIPLLSPELTSYIKRDPRWFTNDFIFPLLNSPLLWSPDGRYLAFSAALDGRSSDLYVYDTATDRVTRLTDGPNQAWVMSWSPDSKWIIHAESTSMLFDHGSTIGHPITKAVWAASPDGRVKKVYNADLDIHQIQGWVSQTTFVEQTLRFYGPYQHSIRLVDIRSGSSSPLYPCFGHVNAISSSAEVLFWSEGFEERWADTDALLDACSDPLPAGQYVYKDGITSALPDDLAHARWDQVLSRLFLSTPRGFELWDIQGQLATTFSEERCQPSVSEDGEWLVFVTPCDADSSEIRRIRIYTSGGDLVQEAFGKANNLYWDRESSGVYIMAERELWYFSRRDGEIYLLHPDIGVNWITILGQ